MASATVTGFGGATGVFSLDPEFPVRERRVRRAEQSAEEAGMWQRRQRAKSHGETSLREEVREWTLEWNMASKAEADALRAYHDQSRGSAGLLLYYPPTETDASNLCTSPQDFKSISWKRGTDETTVGTDATVLPAGVGGSAYLLQNGGSATAPAFIYAQGGRYPAKDTIFAYSVYVRRPSSNPSQYATVRLTNLSDSSTDYATYNFNGAAWVFSSGSGDGVPQAVDAGGGWYRIAFVGVAGTEFAGSPVVGSYPEKRRLEIETGQAANPEAGKDLLIAGAMLEEAKAVTNLSGFGNYNAERRHVLVRMMDNPLQIERWSSIHYRMSCTLREVPSAPAR